MKIKKEFYDLIKSSEKTIEIRKVGKIRQYHRFEYYNDNFSINFNIDNSKIKKDVTFSGYQNFKKEFLLKIYKIYHEGQTPNYRLPTWWYTNLKWLLKYEDFIFDYLKDEEEFVILFIESWE